jgi:hypothetical protein
VSSTEEPDYAHALEWYGLAFAPETWKLAARADAIAAQREHLAALFRQ